MATAAAASRRDRILLAQEPIASRSGPTESRGRAYFQLYSDARGVCRVYQMSIGNGEWKLWREGEPFSQRFTATLSDDRNTITGRWEIAEDGTNDTTDFDLIYRRVDT
jgi:hypothetical protein